MKVKILRFLAVILALMVCSITYAEESVKTLSTGISLNQQVPISLMGTWRVASVLKNTNSPVTFKKSGVDIWNLSKSGDVITLSNPFTGASASIKVSYVSENTVKFSKEGNYDNKNLTDTVEITLSADKFQGVNTLSLEDIQNGAIKSVKTAEYILRGEKISGTSILER